MNTLRGGCVLMVGALISLGTGCQNGPRQTGESESVDLTAGRVYDCRHAAGPIVLDGKLDESAWRRAQRIEHFRLYRPGGQYPYTTVGRLTWDDDNLYVAFECTDDDVKSASTTHDDYLAAADVVELYIKYGEGHEQYYEIVSAPNGTTFDARWPRRGAGDFRQWTPWESDMRSAVAVDGTPDMPDDRDGGYTVEMAIPWKSFDGFDTPPAVGTVWTFGLFRYDHGARFSEPYLTMSLAGSPEHGFHYYEAYHPIVFER